MPAKWLTAVLVVLVLVGFCGVMMYSAPQLFD